MTEHQTIEYVDGMDVFEKSRLYMEYVLNVLVLRYWLVLEDVDGQLVFKYLWKDLRLKSFEEFCDKSNVVIHCIDFDNWEERGYASKSWVNFNVDSIYYYVYHSIK